MSDDIVENLKQPSQWLRIVYMIVLAIALEVTSIILTLVVIGQALITLVTGNNNENLRGLAKDLAVYVNQIILFLTYNSEQRPFPFAPFPGSSDEASLDPVTPPVPEEPAAAAQNATPKKKPAAAKKQSESSPTKKPAPKKATGSASKSPKKSVSPAAPKDDVSNESSES